MNGEARLALVEEVLNRATTLTTGWDVTIEDDGVAPKKLALSIRQKARKELWEFTAPPDVKGTKLLRLAPEEGSDDEQLYVFLPAFGKVRRIAANATEAGFMGMTFSVHDHLTRFARLFTVRRASALTETLLLDAPTPYARLELTLSKDDLPTELKYFDAAGTLVKTETRTFACDAAGCLATVRRMVDHVRKSSTTMTRTSVQVNEPLDDALFTKRALTQ